MFEVSAINSQSTTITITMPELIMKCNKRIFTIHQKSGWVTGNTGKFTPSDQIRVGDIAH